MPPIARWRSRPSSSGSSSGEYLTGLLYIGSDQPELHALNATPDVPLNQIPYAQAQSWPAGAGEDAGEISLIKWAARLAVSAMVVALLAVAGYLVHTRAPRVETAARHSGSCASIRLGLPPRSFVYLFSGAQGWSGQDEETRA